MVPVGRACRDRTSTERQSAAVRAAVHRLGGRDPPEHPAAGQPAAGAAHHGGAAGREREHRGRRLPDAGSRGLGGGTPPQRLLCAKNLRYAAPPPPGARPCRGAAPRRKCTAVRSFHRQRGHSAVPGAQLGAAAARTFIPAPGAFAARRNAGRCRPARTDCVVSFGLPRGVLHARPDRGGRGH